MVDTTTSRVFVNNADFLTNLKISSSKIKGVGGKGFQIAGTGKLILHIKSDFSETENLSNLDAVIVPSCL